MKNKKNLVVASHPDDEVLECGGTIKKYSKDNEIYLLLMGVGLNARLKNGKRYSEDIINKHLDNSKKVAKLLGIKEIFNYDYPDNRFDTVSFLDIVKSIEKVLLKVKPEIIFTQSNTDLNIDHRITFQAVLTATRPLNNCSVKEIYSFEVQSSTEWSFGKINGMFFPNLFIDISQQISDKIKALKIYESEVSEFPHPRSEKAIISCAEKWAYMSGLNNAEAFEIIRIIK